jgi:curved DNA-binding protein
VRFAHHPDLSVRGDDIFQDLDLAPWEALLGVKVKNSTLGEPIALTVPPGTAAGTHLRVRGQDLPREDGNRGDLFAVVQLSMPTAVGPDEQVLWEKIAALSTFNPRRSL